MKHEHGLYFGAALTYYDSDPEPIEDPKYGELVISWHGWGNTGEVGYQDIDLDLHYCSDEELGLTRRDDTSMYPIDDSSYDEILLWKRKFKCAKPEDYEIWGDYNSNMANQMLV